MPALSIMIKPASSLCNMRCKYCFYHSLSEERELFSYGLMSDETAKNIITQALESADGESVYFVFQGGEPTLRGIDFFRNFINTVKALNSKHSVVNYALQTNGTLIDDEWAKLFKDNNFLIGLSLDGDRKANRFRLDNNRESTFPLVMKAVDILRRYAVDFNILTVVTAYTAYHIEEIYKWLRGKDFRYLQFIPCLRPFDDDSKSDMYMTVEQYGDYLIKLFTLYAKDYMSGRYISIREMDNLVRLYLGGRPEQCGVSGHCSRQYVIEGDGSVFPCDFYCTDDWKLGNINEQSFESMENCERATRFLTESYTVKSQCKDCMFFRVCRGGGCKRMRADKDYCEAYRKFFGRCLPMFRAFSNEKV